MRIAFVSMGAVALFASVGCVDENPSSDVRGNYSLSYDDTVTVKVRVGGAVEEKTASSTEVVTFDVGGQPLELDLGAFCARDDVTCPSEVLWSAVAIDQPNIEARNPNTHVLNVINNEVRDLPPGQEAAVVSGLIDAQDRFGLILGARSQDNGDCGLLTVSTAGGRFSHEGETVEVIEPDIVDGGADAGVADDGGEDLRGAPRVRVTWPEGAPVDGIADGKVSLGFLGLCAFGPAVVGATVELTTGFIGVRTGDFDPPPFTPLDPEDVDGGLALPDDDGGGAGGPSDAGSGPALDAGVVADGG